MYLKEECRVIGTEELDKQFFEIWGQNPVVLRDEQLGA